MKKLIFVFLILTCMLKLQAQNSEVTTYYFIRHAEKVRTDKTDINPNLTEKGMSRAQYWKTVFGDIDFDIIYSTNYNRTIQTAEPTAISKGLKIQFYNPKDLFNQEFQVQTKGKTVLVVGHSNSTPTFVNKVLNSEKYPKISDTNNSNLYIVMLTETSINDILLKVEH